MVVGCSRKEGPNKIGVILPLSGDAASYGLSLKSGMDLAVTYANKTTSDQPHFELLYEDSKAEPSAAVTAFQKLITVDQVKVVIGPFTSSEVLAIAPVAEERRVVLLAPTASAPSITRAGDYIFRITPSDEFDGGVLARFAASKLGAKTASILFSNTDYGVGVEKSFRNQFSELGGTVELELAFSSGTKDFRAQLVQLKKVRSNSILLVGMKELGYVLKQAKEIGVKSQFLATGLFEDTDIMKVAGSAANGVYYSYPSFKVNSSRDEVKEFVEKYRRQFQKDPDVLAAYGYDAVNIVVQAYTKSNSDTIKKNLYETQGFKGATGEMSFDQNGDVVKTFGIKRVVDGKFEWYLDSF
jgi:branched-chain amino acid transport system substrate-binding protein